MKRCIPWYYRTDYEYEDGTPVHHTWWLWLGRVFRSHVSYRPAIGEGPGSMGTPHPR